MTEQSAQTDPNCPRENQCFCMGAGPELFSMFRKLGPDSAREHFRNARIEMLKGMRELINHRIDDLAKAGETKGTRVTVE